MNLFTEQVSALGAVGVRQFDTQLQLQLVANLMSNFQNRVAVLGQTVNSWINPATVISTLSINA